MSSPKRSFVCLYCGEVCRSPLSLSRHLDTCHEGWVESILAHLGVTVPGLYPVPEYRSAIAQAFATGPSPRPN